MTDHEILDLIQRSLQEVVPKRGIKLADLQTDATLRELGVDSLSAMELVTVLEARTGRTFADETLSRVHKVADLLALVRGVGGRAT